MTTPIRPEIKLEDRRGLTVCNTCGTETDVRCVSFRWHDDAGRVALAGGTAVALCKACRHLTLAALAEEFAP